MANGLHNGLHNGLYNGVSNGVYDGLDIGLHNGLYNGDGKLGVIKDGLKLYVNPSISNSYIGSGVKMLDLSGNNNNGTLVGGAVLKKTNEISYIQLDGISGYISFPLTGFAPPSNTYSFWVKGAYTGILHVIDNADQPNNRILWNTARCYARIYDNGAYVINTVGSILVNEDAWNNVTVCLTNGSQKVYINGVLDTTLVGTGSYNGNPNNNAIAHNIGYWAVQPGFPNIKVGAYLFYNRMLSASEVKFNYEYLKPFFIR